jgi:hypothetical protein
LTRDASEKVRHRNYERVFDAVRHCVRTLNWPMGVIPAEDQEAL